MLALLQLARSFQSLSVDVVMTSTEGQRFSPVRTSARKAFLAAGSQSPLVTFETARNSPRPMSTTEPYE
jgi:hypothetical protein